MVKHMRRVSFNRIICTWLRMHSVAHVNSLAHGRRTEFGESRGFSLWLRSRWVKGSSHMLTERYHVCFQITDLLMHMAGGWLGITP